MFWTDEIYEDRFKSLAFRTLSQLTISKFNDLPDHIDDMTDQYFIVANRMVRVIQSNSRASSSEQQKFIRSKQERLLNKLVRLCSVNIYFFVQDSITAAKIESEVEYVINDLSLIPKGALSDVEKKRTKFNAQRKVAGHRAFGSEYVHQFLNISDCNHIFSQLKRLIGSWGHYQR